ncbi:hypothetical protein [Ancylomarina sp.]|uniref:hypothetical protein n=1 Tax=Ancylomarina sp. TaxID=1970196 RepID=UPI0035687BD1
MKKNKRNKAIKIIGIIVIVYLILDIVLHTFNLTQGKFYFSNPLLPDTIKYHFYFIAILKFVILLSLLLLVIKGLRKGKWIIYPITILILFFVSKYYPRLPFITHAIVKDIKTDKINYDDIIQLQTKSADTSLNKVKVKNEYLFTYNRGKLMTKGEQVNITQYDLNGNIVKDGMTNYSHDSLGNLIKEIRSDNNGKADTIKYKYNKNNLQTEKKHITSKYSSTTTYDYDLNGNKARQKIYKNNFLKTEITWKYDSLMREISRTHHHFKDDRVKIYTFIYDGNTKSTYESDFNGGVQKRIFTYDSLGNEIKQMVIDKNGKEKFSFITNYNSTGKKIEEYRQEDGKKSMKKQWNYDRNGFLTYAIDHYGSGPLKRIEYTYKKQLLTKTRIINIKNNEPISEKIYLYEYWKKN